MDTVQTPYLLQAFTLKNSMTKILLQYKIRQIYLSQGTTQESNEQCFSNVTILMLNVNFLTKTFSFQFANQVNQMRIVQTQTLKQHNKKLEDENKRLTGDNLRFTNQFQSIKQLMIDYEHERVFLALHREVSRIKLNYWQYLFSTLLSRLCARMNL